MTRLTAKNRLFFILPLMMAFWSCAKEKTRYVYIERSDSPSPLWQQSGDGDATRAFGRALVREGKFVAEASTRPWSGWWYPAYSTYLFEGNGSELSPLQKYDQWVSKTKGITSRAAEYERQHLYNPHAGDWAGLCDAWAIASIMEREPDRTEVTVDGIRFGVGDMKALLVETYEDVQGLKQFGQRYNGQRGDDFNDIYPDQFHRVLQEEIFEKRRPFVMDIDPGVEVWNYPVFQAAIQITRDNQDSHIMHVQTDVGMADLYASDHDERGALVTGRTYTYDLYGIPQTDGSFDVRAGMWMGTSLDDHPDFVTVLPTERPVRGSRNLDVKSEWVDELYAKYRAQAGLLR